MPSASVIFCAALNVEKQYQGFPRRHDLHWPAYRTPVEDYEVTGLHRFDARSHGLDGACRLVAEKEREVVADAALSVVEVGVTDPARLYRDERFTGAGIRDEDCLDGDRLTRALATTPRTSVVIYSSFRVGRRLPVNRLPVNPLPVNQLPVNRLPTNPQE